MDPKQLAEEIIDNLFSEIDPNDEIEETEEYEDDLYEEVEDEDETEEDDSEDESEDDSEDESEDDYEEDDSEDSTPMKSTSEPKVSGGSNLGSTLNMKPSYASAQMPTGGVPSSGGDLESDANGGGSHDIMGRGFELGTKQYVGPGPGQIAGTLSMKPSSASPQMPSVFGPSLNKEELQRDVRAMFGGSEDLSEEFVSKAASLYEAAIVTKINMIAGALREELAEQFSNKIVEVKETLEEQLDTYLNYVVEEWIKENEIAVESGLRTEISENFIRGLKNLFTESYIEVPEEKTNVFDELSEAVSHLENRLNEEIETNANLINKIKSLKAQQIFQEQTSHLTALEAEQIRHLAENVAFESEKDYSEKVSVLVEGYVNTAKPKKTLKESKQQTKQNLFERVILEEETEEEIQQISPSMEIYSRAIERSLQK